MASPESTRKVPLRRSTWGRAFCSPVRKTIPQAMASTTMVRMAVARLDSMFATPSFPKRAVRLANTAEPRA